MYSLPDLCPALLDFFARHSNNPSSHHVGGRRGTLSNTLPFTDVIVWHSLQMQTYSLDDDSVTNPRRLNAMPPCDPWPLRRYDTAEQGFFLGLPWRQKIKAQRVPVKVGPRLYSVKELQAVTGEQLRRKREGGETRRELETKQEEQRDRESSERVPRGLSGTWYF
jgi:hypothetical protein